MQRLHHTLQRYDWGSLTALPELLRVPPDGAPWAELWWGAHDRAPSRLDDGTSLDTFIAADAPAVLGPQVAARFGGQLPFLLKVLAPAQPLSLQAHPGAQQAAAGFARENAAGVPLNAPHRNYRDARHKPELLCALTRFEALCGFRPVEDSVRLLRGLGLDTALLERDGLRAYFTHVLTARVVLPPVTPVPGFERACALASRLQRRWPEDPAVTAALLLNDLVLEPGEALFLPAGNLHAYVEGVAVELMANSDNVLRGGLTNKHRDVPELLNVLDFTPGLPKVWRGAYDVPAEEFHLTRVQLDGAHTFSAAAQIVLVTRGEASIDGLRLASGEAVFIGAGEPSPTFTGQAELFRAAPGTLL